MLSLPATKKEPYMFPLMPVFALMCADALSLNFLRWCRIIFWGWMGICVISLVFMGLSLIWHPFLPEGTLPHADSFIKMFTFRHAIAIAGAGFCIFLMARKPAFSLATRMIAVTALFYIGMIAVAWHAIDLENGIQNRIHNFWAQIPPEKRNGIASYQLYEYALADIYFYCDWVFPELKDSRQLEQVIEGEHPAYHSVVIESSGDLSGLVTAPYQVTAEINLGSIWLFRPLRLVEGARPEYPNKKG
jgi:hypothetical protein